MTRLQVLGVRLPLALRRHVVRPVTAQQAVTKRHCQAVLKQRPRRLEQPHELATLLEQQPRISCCRGALRCVASPRLYVRS